MNPQLAHVCDLVVELSRSHELGTCPSGTRRIIPIVGGRASGPVLNGRILDVGADWQTVRADGVAELDARYAIETDDGALVEVISQGIRSVPPEVAERIAAGDQVQPSEYYMRTAMRLESGHPAYEWVCSALFLATGGKSGNTVKLSVYQVG